MHLQCICVPVAPHNQRLRSTSAELKEGDNLSAVSCSAECNPDCTYSWHKGSQNGPVVTKNDKLALTSVTKEQHGSYYCKATNVIGRDASETFSLTVNCEY